MDEAIAIAVMLRAVCSQLGWGHEIVVSEPGVIACTIFRSNVFHCFVTVQPAGEDGWTWEVIGHGYHARINEEPHLVCRHVLDIVVAEQVEVCR